MSRDAGRPDASVTFPADAGRVLVDLSRTAVGAHLGIGPSHAQPDPTWTTTDGAAFVTLTRDGRLRGCIGTLEAYRPLADDVRDNAVAAAVRDPRFPALTTDELPEVRVEVSVLSPETPLPVVSVDEATRLLRPHVDGVILRAGGRRGTFLPQVWEQLPDPVDFLDHLVVKARLPRGYWDDDVRLSTYTVTAWHEVTPGGDVEPVPGHDDGRPV